MQTTEREVTAWSGWIMIPVQIALGTGLGYWVFTLIQRLKGSYGADTAAIWTLMCKQPPARLADSLVRPREPRREQAPDAKHRCVDVSNTPSRIPGAVEVLSLDEKASGLVDGVANRLA